MSYSSQSVLREAVSERDVLDLVALLGYKYISTWDGEELGKVKEYYWFDNLDHKSTSGVELSVHRINKHWCVSTRSVAGRSYYDLEQQNKTIRLFKKYFGGYFQTDEGKGRYLQPEKGPPEPSAVGCHLAFNNFGNNLIRAKLYFNDRLFSRKKNTSQIPTHMEFYDPRVVSNSLILPFLVSISEDYWKSSFVALLKYSTNKDSVFKSGRISVDRLVQMSNAEISVEQGFADSLSFARISIVCNHFKQLDKHLDFASILRKPHRGRNLSLFDSLEKMTENRNKIIHEAGKPLFLSDDYIRESFIILNDSIEKCYLELTRQKKWDFFKGWSIGE